MLTTRQKLFLVRLASGPTRLITGNREPGKKRVQRRGIEWELDLDEAIDFMIFLLGAFEPGTIRTYGKIVRAGSVVLDIGANVGAHTLPLAQLVGSQGRVFGFEPTKYAFSKLQANAALNPSLAPCINAEQILLSDVVVEHSVTEIASSWRLRPSAEAHALHRGEGKTTAGARTTTLDAYVAEAGIAHIDLIKMDVDGNELSVLRGAEKTLARDRPWIIFELAPYILEEHGSSGTELLTLLQDAGYEFARSPNGPALTTSIKALVTSVPVGASINLWARAK